MSHPKLLLAIDPGSKDLGYALFKKGFLSTAGSINGGTGDRYERTRIILDKLFSQLEELDFDVNSSTINQVLICEEPVTQGHASVALNRVMGAIEQLFNLEPIYYKPTQIKAAMGKGSLDKDEVKKAVLTILNDEEVTAVEKILLSDDDDAVDAIAIGLTALGRHGKSQRKEACMKKKKTKKSKKRPVYSY